MENVHAVHKAGNTFKDCLKSAKHCLSKLEGTKKQTKHPTKETSLNLSQLNLASTKYKDFQRKVLLFVKKALKNNTNCLKGKYVIGRLSLKEYCLKVTSNE